MSGIGYDTTNHGLELIGVTSNVTLSSISGNQGTIDISTLKCGGTVIVLGPVAPYSIEGFTSKPAGFWFNFLGSIAEAGTLLNEDATATATNRIVGPHNEDMIGQGINATLFYGASRWHANTGNVALLVSSKTTATSTGDIGKLGGELSLVGDSMLLRNALDSARMRVTSDGLSLEARGVGDFVDVWAALGLRVASGLLGTSPGFIRVVEASASTPSVAAGEGMFWVRNDAPSVPMFTDDENTDWRISTHVVANLTARTDVTNSAAAQTLASYTMPANMPAGTTIRCDLGAPRRHGYRGHDHPRVPDKRNAAPGRERRPQHHERLHGRSDAQGVLHRARRLALRHAGVRHRLRRANDRQRNAGVGASSRVHRSPGECDERNGVDGSPGVQLRRRFGRRLQNPDRDHRKGCVRRTMIYIPRPKPFVVERTLLREGNLRVEVTRRIDDFDCASTITRTRRNGKETSFSIFP